MGMKKQPPMFHTVTVTQHGLDTLEAALCQLAERESDKMPSIIALCRAMRLTRAAAVIDAMVQARAAQQTNMQFSESPKGENDGPNTPSS